jgi:hypothetical protein
MLSLMAEDNFMRAVCLSVGHGLDKTKSDRDVIHFINPLFSSSFKSNNTPTAPPARNTHPGRRILHS